MAVWCNISNTLSILLNFVPSISITQNLALKLLPPANGVANVMFSGLCVCLVCSWKGTLHRTPDQPHPLYSASPDIFRLVQIGPRCTAPPPPPLDIFKLVHYVGCVSVRKQPIGSWLKCLLVCRKIAQLTTEAKWEPLFVSSQSQMDEWGWKISV